MFENLKMKNSDLVIYSVYDAEFKKYGKIINDLDVAEIVKVGESIEMLKEGSSYTASFEPFEKLAIAEEIRVKCFGQTPCQIGYCYGHSSFLNALEWHSCNEINIAITDAVLILAKRSDFDVNNTLHSSDCKIFFVPKGTAIEVYSDTLHFCPCEVSKEGFGMVVGLSKDTNTPLEFKTEDKTLWAKNKWLLAHCDNTSLVERGAKAGIFGKNIEIKY